MSAGHGYVPINYFCFYLKQSFKNLPLGDEGPVAAVAALRHIMYALMTTTNSLYYMLVLGDIISDVRGF